MTDTKATEQRNQIALLREENTRLQRELAEARASTNTALEEEVCYLRGESVQIVALTQERDLHERLAFDLQTRLKNLEQGATFEIRELVKQRDSHAKTIKALGEQLESDRTMVAECLTKANRAIDSRHWLTEGRGSYEWNDDRWHEEFYQAAEEIKAAIEPLTKIATNWKDCPQSTTEVAKARIDQAKTIEGLREALEKLWKHTAKIDNSYCAVCRVGRRSFDTKGNVAGKCSDDRCLSHVVEAALRASTTAGESHETL